VLCVVQLRIMSILMAITSLVAGIVAILGSVIACRVTTTTARFTSLLLLRAKAECIDDLAIVWASVSPSVRPFVRLSH